jgi:hypothetical protein
MQIGNKRLKVQHKQIRPRDLNDRGDLQDFGSMSESSYRMPFPGALPPSGPTSQSTWYDRRSAVSSDGGLGDEVVAVVGSDGSLLSPSQQQFDADSNPNGSGSPLSTLGSLQAALPDVSGTGTAD